MVPFDKYASRVGAAAGRIGCAGLALLIASLFAALPAAAGPMTLGLKGDARCRFGAGLHPFQPQLAQAREIMRNTGTLKIVALGSSTTAGAGASAEDKSYPAVLAAELRRRLPDIDVSVVNKGVGGQSAYDMLQRMESDVVEQKPAIVIWQTVVNDAIRDIGEDKLAKILRKGIRQAKDAGIDMVLMDLQWLPRDDRYPKYDDYRATLAKVAKDNEVSLFPRYGMMKNWARSKHFSPEEIVGMDGMHIVDAGYRCLAVRVADGIVSGLTGAKQDFAEAPPPTE